MSNDTISNKKFLITGGAGFIGSSVIRLLIDETMHNVLNVDKLTYASNLDSLKIYRNNTRYQFVQGDVCNQQFISQLFEKFQPDIVMHLAAETHVDRSIDGPSNFIQTNVLGTYAMLECARKYWSKLKKQNIFRFHHISTDEVYGSLGDVGLFTEESVYDPSSPYSATKASSDHLVRAWHRTYGLPVIITNCSNNYGPYQFPEKLIPLMILNALEGKPLPIYGNGQNIRDWLYVEDHAQSLYRAVSKGKVGETYNIGGHNEKTNIEVVTTICETLDELVLRPLQTGQSNKYTHLLHAQNKSIKSYKDLITFVSDRPGHDIRYAIDASKIKNELDWTPNESFQSGIKKTIIWYLNNLDWCKKIQDGVYKRQRLGDLFNKKKEK